VGDVSFRVRARNKMMDLIHSGKTVLFVSHDIMAVEEFCDRVIWLEKGEIIINDKTENVLSKYMMSQRSKAIDNATPTISLNETGLIFVTKCELIDERGVSKEILKYQDKFIIRIHYKTKQRVENPFFMTYIYDYTGRALFIANMLADGGEPEYLNGEGYIDINFGRPNFYPGAYSVKVQIRKDSNTEHFFLKNVLKFEVEIKPEDFNMKGKYKNVYSFGQGIAQPYSYTIN
jgi:lipopolysaccharide transport system ATP-binding protein